MNIITTIYTDGPNGASPDSPRLATHHATVFCIEQLATFRSAVCRDLRAWQTHAGTPEKSQALETKQRTRSKQTRNVPDMSVAHPVVPKATSTHPAKAPSEFATVHLHPR